MATTQIHPTDAEIKKDERDVPPTGQDEVPALITRAPTRTAKNGASKQRKRGKAQAQAEPEPQAKKTTVAAGPGKRATITVNPKPRATGKGKAAQPAAKGASKAQQRTKAAPQATKPAGNGKAQVARNAYGVAIGSKAAAVLDLVMRPGGATTTEIREKVTPLIRQVCRGLRKSVKGFTFTSEKIEGERGRLWKGTIAK